MDILILVLVLLVGAAVIWAYRKSANDQRAEREATAELLEAIEKYSREGCRQSAENKRIIEARFDHSHEILTRLAQEVKRFPTVRGRDPKTGRMCTMVMAQVDPETGEVVRVPDPPAGWAGDHGASG